jgi:hypothetical protein
LAALFTWSNLSQEPGKSRKERKEKYDESALDFTGLEILFLCRIKGNVASTTTVKADWTGYHQQVL